MLLMFQTILALFTGERVLDVIKLLSQKDMSDKEYSDFVLEYLRVTKHQSPIRRAIAFIIILLWALLVITWLGTSMLHAWLELDSLRMLANTIKIFMKDILLEPVNLVIVFYFTIHLAAKLGK